MARAGHATGSEREGQDDVCDWVDDHVDDDAVEAVQALLVVWTQPRGLLHSAPQVEEQETVQHDGAELGEEDPDVVAPEALAFVEGAEPALCLLASS